MHVCTRIPRFMHGIAKPSHVQGLTRKHSVQAVVFDYGNVLCLEQTLEDMKGMALVSGIPDGRFSEFYWKLRPPYDRGEIDGPAYRTAVVRQQELRLSRDQIATLIKLDSESIIRLTRPSFQSSRSERVFISQSWAVKMNLGPRGHRPLGQATQREWTVCRNRCGGLQLCVSRSWRAARHVYSYIPCSCLFSESQGQTTQSAIHLPKL